jgi:methionine-rich copper-binding protein CopC
VTNIIERGSSMRRHTMAFAHLVAAGLVVLIAGQAAGHETVVSSEPAAGAVLADPPDEVVVVFSGEIDPDGSSFVVVDASGAQVGAGEVDLAVADRNVLTGAVSIEDDGIYEVRWTAASADGHTEQGSFAFTVGDEAAPNTALRPSQPLAPIGLALLLAAAVAGIAILRSDRRR